MKILFLIIKTILIGLSLWLILVAGEMGYANLHYFNANNQLNRWMENDDISSKKSYQQSLAAIQLSNEMHPENPKYLETQAAIEEWGITGEYAEASNYNLALSHYDKAIQLRPLWPWAWVSKIETKWRMEEIDDEMLHAMEMLDKAGPYEKDAHLAIVNTGLMLMMDSEKYAEQAEKLVAEHYRRGIGNSRAVKPLKAIVEDYEAEDIAKEWVD